MKPKSYIIFISLITLQFSCKKLVEIDPPRTSLTAKAIFSSNETSIAAVTQLYAIAAASDLRQADLLGLSTFPGMSSDEFFVFGQNSNYLDYNRNTLSAIKTTVAANQFWNLFYKTYIYNCNRIIEGLNVQKTSDEDPTSKLNLKVKKQLLGEAHFIRALSYFYLVQMYGDVPLLISTDYILNSTFSRTKKDQVYSQIIDDLKVAEVNLSDTYLQSDLVTIGESRVRPIKWAAKSLLSRVFLYTENNFEAEKKAKEVINNIALYELTSLDDIFLSNSKEAIWQLQPVINGRNSQEAWVLSLPPNGPDANNYPFYLNPEILNAFEPGDYRKTSWIRSRTIGGVTYNYPYKYKSALLNDPVIEYSTLFRLAEQYLICAEALAKENKIEEAKEMLNAIRKRAGLGNTPAMNKDELLEAIIAERRVELFSEFGHRWFDLKRLGKVDEVMKLATPLKGGTGWESYQAYYPIMPTQLELNRNVSQTIGY